jgi:hypothetical protein
MPSPKWSDLEHDPRLALHSSVSDINGSEGEFKVYGRGVLTEAPAVRGHDEAWWSSRTPDKARTYGVEIREAVLVAWAPDFGRMRTMRWTSEAGARDDERRYP